MFEQRLEINGTLSAVVHHVDGHDEDLGIISGRKAGLTVAADPEHKQHWYERLYHYLRDHKQISASLPLGAFLAYEIGHHLSPELRSMPGLCEIGNFAKDMMATPAAFGLVTATGATYLATDFASGQASPHIGAFNFHDLGTGGAHGSTVNIASVSNVGGQLQLTCSTAHGATTNDIWLVTGVTGTGITNPSNWQVTVVSSTVLGLVGLSASGSYAVSSGTVQLINGAADTALTTPAGTARVAGTQTNPSAGQYQTVATISFTSSLAIVEWGLFSATTAGTMWDRRWFNNGNAPSTTATGPLTPATINVTNGMSVTYTYNLSVNSGGS